MAYKYIPSPLQESILDAWAEKQGSTKDAVLDAAIRAFAVDMGLDPMEPEADQLAELQHVSARYAARKVPKAAQQVPEPETPAP